MSHHKHHSREEIAKIEIGHTDSTPAINGFLTLFFLIVITAVPLLQTGRELAAIRAGEEPGRDWPQPWNVFTTVRPQWHELRAVATAGSMRGAFAAMHATNSRMLRDIAAYESDLKARDAAVQWLIPRMQIPVTAWLKGGNEDAYCGRDGWLFYRRGIDSLTGRGFLDPEELARRAAGGSELKAPPQPDPLKAIVDFRDQLAERGIALLVVPAPVKPTVYPERHSSRYAGQTEAVQNPSYADFIVRLEAAGVAYFDPAPGLLAAKTDDASGLLYLKTDTHWTPAGLELTARDLAARARQIATLAPAQDRFGTVETQVTNLGDIAMMLKFPEGMTVFEPETVTLRQVTDGKSFWRASSDSEVLVLGDSFANIFSLAPMGWGEAAGLVEHLSLALGLPVDAITRNDAGSYATREMLSRELRRGNDRLAGKKLVIWEFAARELALGDWKILPMDLGEKIETDFYEPEGGRVINLTGVVRGVSPSPRPGSVPYKDHILMIHLVDLESSDDPRAAGEQAVVFAWSMRDNKPTPAARYRQGETVTLQVRAWADVAAQYEAINRSELDDDELMLAVPIWGEL